MPWTLELCAWGEQLFFNTEMVSKALKSFESFQIAGTDGILYALLCDTLFSHPKLSRQNPKFKVRPVAVSEVNGCFDVRGLHPPCLYEYTNQMAKIQGDFYSETS